ncbi:retrovirus-related pol polyprotein from transposon 17.6 [Tanacetum coccineum]
MACPTCNEDTPSARVLSKTTYVGHRRFLKKAHKLRRLLKFNGETDDRDPPRKFISPEIDTYLAKFKSEFPNQDIKEEFLGWFGTRMSTVVARGHDGDGGDDDPSCPPPCLIRTGCRGVGGQKPNRGGRRSGRLGTSGETRNLGLRKLTDE